LPAAPASVGVAVVNWAPGAGVVSDTWGATVSIVKVRGRLVPTLPWSSLCWACAVKVPSASWLAVALHVEPSAFVVSVCTGEPATLLPA
jgi:hypothetical protein